MGIDKLIAFLMEKWKNGGHNTHPATVGLIQDRLMALMC